MAYVRCLVSVAAVAMLAPATLARGGDDAGPESCAPCPAGAIVEPDDCDFGNPDPNDQVNGGCNATPPAFLAIECGDTVCGTVYFDGAKRDTDWYRLDLCGWQGTLELTGRGDAPMVFGRVDNDGVDDCRGVTSFAEFAVVDACEQASVLTAGLTDGGVYWVFAGAQFGSIVDCGAGEGDYTLSLGCEHFDPPWIFACSRWDLNFNEIVGFEDLVQLLAIWGPCGACAPFCQAHDVDDDAAIGFAELLALLADWGPTGPPGDCVP